MTRRVLPAWRLVVFALAAVALAALSLAPGWLLHVRHVGGHGLTAISVTWSAWEGRAWPFLPLAAAGALLLAVAAMAELLRRGRVPARWLATGALVCLGLTAGSAVPLDRLGYASRVQVTPAWALILAVGLATTMVVAAAAEAWTRRATAVAGIALLVLAGGAYAGRVVALNLAEGDPRHYRDGAYIREAADAQATQVLTIRDGTYRVGERWSGTISGRGLVAVLTEDPACPGARGAYRVFGAGGEDIRWNLIVDLCLDGARAEDLTTGIWRRQP